MKESIKASMQNLRPGIRWISTAVLVFCVIAVGITAEKQVRTKVTALNDQPAIEVCTTRNYEKKRLFVRYH